MATRSRRPRSARRRSARGYASRRTRGPTSRSSQSRSSCIARRAAPIATCARSRTSRSRRESDRRSTTRPVELVGRAYASGVMARRMSALLGRNHGSSGPSEAQRPRPRSFSPSTSSINEEMRSCRSRSVTPTRCATSLLGIVAGVMKSSLTIPETLTRYFVSRTSAQSTLSSSSKASNGSARTLASSFQTPTISHLSVSRRNTSSVCTRGSTSQACLTPACA